MLNDVDGRAALVSGVVTAAVVAAGMALVDLIEPVVPVTSGLVAVLAVALFPAGALSRVDRRGWIAVAAYFAVLQVVLTLQLVSFLTGAFPMFRTEFVVGGWNALSVPSVAVPYALGAMGFSDLGEFAFFAVPAMNALLLALALGALRLRKGRRSDGTR